MKKFIALCLLAFNIAASALAAEIPYIDRVQPEYRAAAEGYLIEATSPQDVERRVKNYVPAQSSITFETVNAKSLYGAADVPLYIYRPAKNSEAKLPVVYYAHGGGYLFRISLDDRERYQNIANALNAAVITPRYRLSVEAPFPAALEDAYSGLMYVKENADKLDLDAGRIILMGDSAGGNLAASLALYNRDNANIPIKGQVLIYPMLDYRTATENSPYHAQQTGYICWPRSSNKYAWEVLRGGQKLSGKMLGYYSPTFAEDFANLPPAFIYVGGLDLFVNEDIDYAAKLTEANVDTELHVIPGLYHAFEIAAPEAGQSKIFWQRVYAFSAEKLAE